jgi:hypothetical protein
MQGGDDSRIRPPLDSPLPELIAKPADAEGRRDFPVVSAPSSPSQKTRNASLPNDPGVTVIARQTHFAPDARGLSLAPADAGSGSVPISSGGGTALRSANDQQLDPHGPEQAFSQPVRQAHFKVFKASQIPTSSPFAVAVGKRMPAAPAARFLQQQRQQ